MNIYIMKHIKLFESFNTEDYYKQITNREYASYAGTSGARYGINHIHFTDMEKKKISEILDSKDLVKKDTTLLTNPTNLRYMDELSTRSRTGDNKYEFDLKTMGGFHGLRIVKDHETSNPMHRDVSTNGYVEFLINKVEDDWYIVAEHIYPNLRGYQYLCDQFEGLLQFIKDKI